MPNRKRRPMRRWPTFDLDWVIVKPSLVIGRGAYGGTALMRGLAGLPYVLPLPGPATERFQPIAADDLARGIAKLVAERSVTRTTLFAAGPEAASVRDILRKLRAWLGFPLAQEWIVPQPMLRLLLRFGRSGRMDRPHRGCEDDVAHPDGL